MTANSPCATARVTDALNGKRWEALKAFYAERGHFLVTNGPYQLKRWFRDSVRFEAFRDLSYPAWQKTLAQCALPAAVAA
jgi:hypothetical protein